MFAQAICNNAWMFDWDHLRFFLAIARRRSLSAAARQLQVQQSTVGRRLAALEATVEARLFDRTPDGYFLTAAGESLLPRAERIEDETLSAEREMLGRESRVAGVVRMTAAQALGNSFLVPLLGRLHAEQPEIVVELVADNVNLSLTKREADLAVRLGRPKQPLLVIRRIGEVMNGLYASRDYLARRGRPRTLELGDHDVVVFDETGLGGSRHPMAWFAHRARGGRPTVRLNSSYGIAAAVQAGLGIGSLPCWLGDTTAGIERVLPAEFLSQELWLVVHRDLQHVARVRAVSEFLARELRRAAPRLLGRAASARRKPSDRDSL
jgi:DNA-binding transcriptional LysR family regulator